MRALKGHSLGTGALGDSVRATARDGVLARAFFGTESLRPIIWGQLCRVGLRLPGWAGWPLAGGTGRWQCWELHPGLTTPQRNMKPAVLSVALLFTTLLCTPADAQVGVKIKRGKRPEAPLEGNGDFSQEEGPQIKLGQRPELPPQALELLRQKRQAAALYV
ncbi:uncharacterized protein PRD47_000105 [Ara ararauna]